MIINFFFFLLYRLIISSTIMIIAVDKCQSICFKNSYRITNIISVSVIVKLIWSIAALLVIPVWKFSDAQQNRTCELDWSLTCIINMGQQIDEQNVQWLNQQRKHLFTLALYFLSNYLFPLLIIIICYGKIYFYLYHYKHNYSHVHDLQKRVRKSDTETVQMLIYIGILFILTWTPIHIVLILPNFTWSTQLFNQIKHWPIQYVLTIFPSISPLLYACFTCKIREKFGSTIWYSFKRISSRTNSINSTEDGINSAGNQTKKNSLEKLLPKCHQSNNNCVDIV